jgi:serine/threonine protein kinase
MNKGVIFKLLFSAISEARILKSLSHTNIVKGFGFRIEEKQFLLLMELMKESVRQRIMRTPAMRLEEKEALRILQQALEGLVFLHTFKPKPIVHRDIKCLYCFDFSIFLMI